MIPPFYRSRLVYQICSYISQQREHLLKELVAYSNDPVRHGRRMRMLQHLAAYEHLTLEKIQNFETQDLTDITGKDLIDQLIKEVDSIVNRSA